MSPAAARVVSLLSPHTPFAEAIVRRQAERAGLDVLTLREADVKRIADNILAAAMVFVDPPTLRLIAHELGVSM